MCSAGDPQSSHYEGLPDAVVKAALMARLRSQHPNKTIPEPSDFFISRHGYDNNTYGAYSVSFAGWKDKDHAELRKPLRNCGDDPEGPPPPAHIPVVRMAGEAMCDDMNGCESAVVGIGATVGVPTSPIAACADELAPKAKPIAATAAQMIPRPSFPLITLVPECPLPSRK